MLRTPAVFLLAAFGTLCSGLTITRSGTVIDGERLSSQSGDCIVVKAPNVVIRNSVIGPCKGVGIRLLSASNVEIYNNAIEEVQSGVYAVGGSRVNVHHNRFLNMNGPFPRGQFVQLNSVKGGGSRINHNEGENRMGESYPEDLVNLYKSVGTPSDPIQVVGNKFKGGGPSKSGGGIMTGDNDGSFMVVRDNVLVDPGQYGIAIAGGEGVAITGNTVYGKKQSFTNVGIYVWRQKNTQKCHSHEVSRNRVRFYGKNGENPSWDGKNCGSIAGWNTNDWHANIDASIWGGLGVKSLLNSQPSPPVPAPVPSRTPSPVSVPPSPRPTPVAPNTGYCAAGGRSITAARREFIRVCGGKVADCDPISGAWVCANQQVRGPAPSPATPRPTPAPKTPNTGYCSAGGSTITAARREFGSVCGGRPVDCDPISGAWVCANQQVRAP